RVVLRHLERHFTTGQAQPLQVLALAVRSPARAAAPPIALGGVLADDVDAVTRLGPDLGAVDPNVVLRHAPPPNDGASVPDRPPRHRASMLASLMRRTCSWTYSLAF